MSNKDYLRITLHKLYYVDDLGSFSGLTAEEFASMRDEYDPDEIKSIIESVGWARENPDFDFSSLLPDLNYSNDEIYEYFCKLDKYFQKS